MLKYVKIHSHAKWSLKNRKIIIWHPLTCRFVIKPKIKYDAFKVLSIEHSCVFGLGVFSNRNKTENIPQFSLSHLSIIQ